MTTQVKVEVPAEANWDALVEVHDEYDGLVAVNTTVVEPGEKFDSHVTGTRHIVVRERAHRPK